MLRVFAGLLAIALMMGTTASQADAASRAGVIQSIGVYGNGGTSLLSCSFRVDVTYKMIHQTGWQIYTVLLTYSGDHYVASKTDSLGKPSSGAQVFISSAAVANGTQYYVEVYVQKLVKGVYTDWSQAGTGTFTQGASCAGSSTTLANYP